MFLIETWLGQDNSPAILTESSFIFSFIYKRGGIAIWFKKASQYKKIVLENLSKNQTCFYASVISQYQPIKDKFWHCCLSANLLY